LRRPACASQGDYAPSTALLCQVAEASVREYWSEESGINAALTGVPTHRPTKAERERVGRGLEELQQRLRPNNAAAAIAAAEARLKQQPQPVAIAVTEALKQAMRERDQLEQWRSEQRGGGK
jgi:predicted DsbA family dithiol-disulfide isomerase